MTQAADCGLVYLDMIDSVIVFRLFFFFKELFVLVFFAVHMVIQD